MRNSWGAWLFGRVPCRMQIGGRCVLLVPPASLCTSLWESIIPTQFHMPNAHASAKHTRMLRGQDYVHWCYCQAQGAQTLVGCYCSIAALHATVTRHGFNNRTSSSVFWPTCCRVTRQSGYWE